MGDEPTRAWPTTPIYSARLQNKAVSAAPTRMGVPLLVASSSCGLDEGEGKGGGGMSPVT